MLTCPVCQLALRLEGRTYRCDRGHAFDRAREGYVDLLPVGHGRSRITGDTREMARARERFLDAGHYAPLSERLAARIAQHLRDSPSQIPESAGSAQPRTPVIAEAGCGTGHYIGAVVAALPEASGFGFDVSREALRVAARARPRITFVVNDTKHRLCLPDGSTDVLLNVFAPRNTVEFRRVLRPDGLLTVVVPGADHIRELRDHMPLLDIPSDKPERTLDQLAGTFDLLWDDALEWRAHLDRTAALDLARMSPSAFHADEATLESAATGGEVGFSFRILGLRPG